MNAVKKIIGHESVHLETRRGTRSEAREYCRKEGKYEEIGEFEKGGQGKRSDLDSVIEKIEDGESAYDIVMQNPASLRYLGNIQKLIGMKRGREALEDREVHVEVYYGASGTGKTRKAWEENKETGAYILDTTNNSTVWFDGYEGQKTLIIDDFYGWIKFGALLRYLDRYPVRLEIKGAFTYASWTKVIITSNKHWSEWYKELNADQEQALRRRIHKVVHFKKMGQWDEVSGNTEAELRPTPRTRPVFRARSEPSILVTNTGILDKCGLEDREEDR